MRCRKEKEEYWWGDTGSRYIRSRSTVNTKYGFLCFCLHHVFPKTLGIEFLTVLCLLLVTESFLRTSLSSSDILFWCLGHRGWTVQRWVSFGTSPVVQWLRPHTSVHRTRVWSLVRELRSHMPHGAAKTHTHTHTHTHTEMGLLYPCLPEGSNITQLVDGLVGLSAASRH